MGTPHAAVALERTSARMPPAYRAAVKTWKASGAS